MPGIPEGASFFQKVVSSSAILKRLYDVKNYSFMNDVLAKHIRYAERYNSYAI